MMAALAVWGLVACRQKGQSTRQSNADTVTLAAVQPAMPVICGVPMAPAEAAVQLKGQWRSVKSASEKTQFIIDDKTIYYPHSHARHPYHTLADSLYIVYNQGYTVPLGYDFNGADTLRLTGEDGPGYYVRVKK